MAGWAADAHPRGTYRIDAARRGQSRANLFHSFGRFSVGTGQTANFTSKPTGITNILSRVTGGQRSDIDGRYGRSSAGAHLYLLNPAGVLFGPNASLDVSGSFQSVRPTICGWRTGRTFLHGYRTPVP